MAVGVILTCAWHDADAELLTIGSEVMRVRPPLPDGRATPTGQGQFQKWAVRRKHEAEPMYVANSGKKGDRRLWVDSWLYLTPKKGRRFES